MSGLLQMKSTSGATIHVVAAAPFDALGNIRSPKWESVRRDFLKGHSSCACCGRNDYLNVHHIQPFHLHPDLELSKSNLITLCEFPSLNCHLFMGHLLNWKLANPRVTADANRYLAMLEKVKKKS